MLGALSVPGSWSAPGKFEVLGKFAKAQLPRRHDVVDADYDQNTTEVNFNYIIKAVQRARDDLLQGHALRRRAARDFKQFGVGLQIQM